MVATEETDIWLPDRIERTIQLTHSPERVWQG